MIKTQTETFRGYGKVRSFGAQTAVECRFGGEVETVLAVSASATAAEAEADSGEVRYRGRARFFIVYEDADKKVCRAEKGVEFSAKAQDEGCCPACTARICLTAENISVRREGASVYLTALFGAEIELFCEQVFPYLTDGEFVAKRETVTLPIAHLCGGVTEAEDEFETEALGDILLHAETAGISSVSVQEGVLLAEGEVNLCILATKEDRLVSFERLIPFRAEIPCEAALSGRTGEAHVSVSDAVLHADSDEEAGKCRIAAELTLLAEGCVYEETAADAVADAFSTECELKLTFAELAGSVAEETVSATERISGKAALSAPVDFSDVFMAVTLQRAEANLVSSPDGRRAEGVAAATLLVLGADGAHRGIEISLPFSVPVREEGVSEVSAFVCGMSARQKQEGEIDAEATLKLTYRRERKTYARALSSAEEGEKLPVCDSAVSVCLPRAGDGLWELSKSLKKSPEDVTASNPDLVFPVKEGQRVIIYRKKSFGN